MKQRRLLNPAVMFLVGLFLGTVSRFLDIYTENLGNIFSQMAIWILMGTLISIYSRKPKQAAWNVLLFCAGMLLTYYAVAVLTSGVYSKVMIAGWSLFGLFSPVLGYVAWFAKEKGVFPKLIGIGIVAVSVASSLILFDGFRIYDWLIDGALVYFLFVHKIKRLNERQ